MISPLATLSRTVGSSAAIAIIETSEGTIDIHRGNGAKATCLRAAEKLRELANDFEMLAREEKPFREETQKKVNRATREIKRAKPPATGQSAPTDGAAASRNGITS